MSITHAVMHINRNTRTALIKGILLGGISILVYVIIVIVTTPELHASFAITAAFSINPLIIFGTAFGVGLNTFISSYNKRISCRTNKKRKGILGISSGITGLSAFFSFFSLVPLGCCGSWLLVLSYLPTIFGSALSVSLIQYSKPLSYMGLVIVLGFAGISAYNLRSELKNRQEQQKRIDDDKNIDKTRTKKESHELG